MRLYQEWKSKQPGHTKTEQEPGEEGITETTRITFEAAEEQAWSEIQKYLQEMNPYDFQELVASLLHAMGYYVSYVAPPGKDGGIDIIAWSDPLGTHPPRIKVQVKRRTDNINVDGIRAFMSLLGEDDAGIFVTTGGFTKDAEDTARNQEKRKITLVNLEQLFGLVTRKLTTSWTAAAAASADIFPGTGRLGRCELIICPLT